MTQTLETPSLTSTLRAREAEKSARLEQARKDYADILLRSTTPEPGDDAKVADLAELLGISADEIEAAKDAVAKRHQMSAKIIPPETIKELTDANTTAQNASTEWNKPAGLCYQKTVAINNAADQARTAMNHAESENKRTREAIAAIEALHPLVFSTP